ncbi:MAG TPA: ISL3 family transposase, partial [Allocoleopsis sp.]
MAAPWARRTVRLAKHLIAIAVELGGKAGERLGQQLGYRIRDNTLLSLFSRVPLPAIRPPTV